MTGGGTHRRLDYTVGTDLLTPEFGPPWLRPLVDNVADIPEAFKRRLPADVLAMAGL